MNDDMGAGPAVDDIVPPEPGSVEHENSEYAEAQAETTRQNNVLEEITRQREELQGQHHLILEIPGYNGLLGVRYNNIGTDITEKVGKKLRKELKARGGEGESLLTSLDTLINACDQIVVKDPDHPRVLPDDKGEPTVWRPIDPDNPVPVRFDRRLASILKFDAGSAREAVLGVFGQEHAVVAQSLAVSRWLTDITREVDQDLLGE